MGWKGELVAKILLLISFSLFCFHFSFSRGHMKLHLELWFVLFLKPARKIIKFLVGVGEYLISLSI